MGLPGGARIGNYEVIGLIGAGGMGEVYRARDARLGRDVAIKILGPAIAIDRDAVLRFEREARALASLNHPNIAAIYDVVEHDGQAALILELVDGETLADRIARGPIDLDPALAYARQIADALDTAHDSGIVHRDLKPANVKITTADQAKILDFGLAKAVAIASGEPVDVNPANSPTVTVQGTRQGVILGTAAYMSPEQARGKRIDKRTDIWAFGCVLFEMLTGRRAFDGETTSDVIAAIIERSPDLMLLPPSTPAQFRRTLERCLAKDPRRRARDIGDVRHELDAPEAPTIATPPRSRGTLPVAVLCAVATIAIAAAVWRWRDGRPAAVATPVEFSFGAPAGYTLLPSRSAVSPDGRYIAFLARDQKQVPSLFLRPVDSSEARRLAGTEGAVNAPAWSPDARSIAFFAGGAWRRINIDGGPAVTIVANMAANLGASWGTGDVLLLAPANRTSLAHVPVSGGTLQPATTLDAEKENSHRWPHLLPDGRHFLFTVRSDSAERLGIKIGSLDGRDTRLLVNAASPGVYADPGWLVYVTPDAALMAQRLDPNTWTLRGTAQPIAGGVAYNGSSFYGMFDASRDGRVLTYLPASSGASTLEWFDRTGKSLGRVGPERPYLSARLARNDGKIAVELADVQLGTRDIWLLDTVTQTLTRFTSHPATDWRATLSPDGSAIAFASDRAGASSVFHASVTSPGTETLLFRTPGVGLFPTDWSADGAHLFVPADDASGRPRQLLKVPLAGGPAVTLLNNEATDLIMPRASPDGDRIAFVSRVNGEANVDVMSLRDRRRVRASINGGTNPVWGPNGDELFFQSSGGELMRVGLNATTITKPPEALFRPCESVGRRYVSNAADINYDISADGRRFLMICDPSNSVPSAITVVVNWQSKLR